MAWINNLKKRLIKNGNGDAIELLNFFYRYNRVEFEKWKKTGSTILLRESLNRFKEWSIYKQRIDTLPFENDLQAIDSAWKKPNKEDDISEMPDKIYAVRTTERGGFFDIEYTKTYYPEHEAVYIRQDLIKAVK